MTWLFSIIIFFCSLCISLGEDNAAQTQQRKAKSIEEHFEELDLSDVTSHYDANGNLQRVDFKKKDGTAGTIKPEGNEEKIDKYYRYYDKSMYFANRISAPRTQLPGHSLLVTNLDLFKECEDGKLDLRPGTHCIWTEKPIEEVTKKECERGRGCKKVPDTFIAVNEGSSEFVNYLDSWHNDYDPNFELKYRKEPKEDNPPEQKPLNAKFYPGKVKKFNEYGDPLNTEYWQDGTKTEGKSRNWKHAPLGISELPHIVSSDDEVIRACIKGELDLPLGTHSLKPVLDAEGNPTEIYSLNGSPALPSYGFRNNGYGYQPNIDMSKIGKPDSKFEVRYRPKSEIKRLPKEEIIPRGKTYDTSGTDQIVSAIDRLREETGIRDEKMLECLHRMRSDIEGIRTDNTEFLKTLASAKTGEDLLNEKLERNEKAKKESAKNVEEAQESEQESSEAKNDDEIALDYSKGYSDEVIATAKDFAGKTIPLPYDPLNEKPVSVSDSDIPAVDNDFWVIKIPSLGGIKFKDIDLNITHYPKVMSLLNFLHNILVLLITGLFLRWVFSEVFELYKIVFSTRQFAVPRERLVPFETAKSAFSIWKKIKLFGKFVWIGVVLSVVTFVVSQLTILSTYLSLNGVDGLTIFSQFKAILFETTGVLGQSIWLLSTVFPILHLFAVIGNVFSFLAIRNHLTPVMGWAFSLLLP